MLPTRIHHLFIGSGINLLDYISPCLEGTVLHIENTNIETIYNSIQEHWPQSIVVDATKGVTQDGSDLDAAWFFALRNSFAVAEIPMIVILDGPNPALEEKLTILPSVSIFRTDESRTPSNEINWYSLGTFVEILIDDALRDPFYDRKPNLQTLERISRLWTQQKSAQLFYGRLNEDGAWTDGYSLTLHRGGFSSLHDAYKLSHALRDPHPSIELLDANTMGDWLGAGEVIFTALKTWIRPGFLRFRQWYALIPNGSKADVAKDLPISLPTRKLLFREHQASDSIHNRLRTLNLRSAQVETEIEILVRLGLYRLESQTLQSKVSKQNTTDLPSVPTSDWMHFLSTALEDTWLQAQHQNLWQRFHWNSTDSLEHQYKQSVEQWNVFNALEDPDNQRRLSQVQDWALDTKRQLQRWESMFELLGQPSTEEQSTLCAVLSVMRHQHPNDASARLQTETHPLLVALRCWINCIAQSDASNVRNQLIELSKILDTHPSGALPLFEAYACGMHMMLGHWSMAQRRLQYLPNAHQTRMLRWNIQQRTLSPQLWIFTEW